MKMSTKISVSRERKRAYLANFVTGKVNESNFNQIESRLIGTADMYDLRRRNNKILVSETVHMSYVGKNFGPTDLDASKKQMRTYVGALDKKTGKMTIYDTDIFYMHPYLPAYDKEGVESGQNMEVINKSTRDKNDLLTSAFGSSKKMRAMEARRRLQVEEETLKGLKEKAVDHGLEQIKAYSGNKVASSQEEPTTWASSTPPCNRNAAKYTEVYQLSSIISDEAMNYIHNDAKLFFDSTSEQIKEWRDKKEYPEYILKHLETLPLNEEDRWKKCKCLRYLYYMIHLYTLSPKVLAKRKSRPLPESWSTMITKNLLEHFTMMVQVGSMSQRCITNRLRDSLASYILTLCLILDEFSLETTDLENALHMKRSKMEQHAKALGCRLNRVEKGSVNVLIIKLRLPLPKPPVNKKKV